MEKEEVDVPNAGVAVKEFEQLVDSDLRNATIESRRPADPLAALEV